MLRYLELCSIYLVHTVYTGEYPYPQHMLPQYPAAFSHNGECGTPSTLVELAKYFGNEEEAVMVTYMMSNSWPLLPIGIAMINADYMARGLGIGEEYRGVRYIGRVDQMSHYISGVVLRAECPFRAVNLIGIGKTGRSVAKGVKSRIAVTGRTVVLHELLQPVSGSMRGISDDDIRERRHSIFLTRGARSQLLLDAVNTHEYSKVVGTDEVLAKYNCLIASSPAVEASNAEVISGAYSSLTGMLGAMEGHVAANEGETTVTRQEMQGLLRCIRAMCSGAGGASGTVGKAYYY